MWLCLGFPLLGLESCSGYDPRRPTALLRGQQVVALNDSARERGLQTGLATATLQALAPDIVLREWEAETEHQALQQLALWAWQYSPGIALWPQQLLLEIGTCLKLFGGAPAILDSMCRELLAQHYSATFGLGDTPLAARLLCHNSVSLDQCRKLLATPYRLDNARVAAAVDAIAIGSMLLEDALPKTIPDKLRGAGITRVGELRGLPLAALGKRFGKRFEHYLARLFGHRPDPQRGFEPAPVFELRRHCLEPIQGKPLLLQAMTALLTPLQQYLQRRQLQTRKVEWRLHRHGGGFQRISVGASLPTDDAATFESLLALQLETLNIKGEIIGIGLHCEEFSEYTADTGVLFAELDHTVGPDIAALLDRLRPTASGIYQIGTADSHIPEQAQQRLRADPAADNTLNQYALKHPGIRPLWLLRSPAPLHSRGRELFWRGPLELLGEPERIAGNWWQRPVHRDYYVARGSSGELYWLFRDNLQQRWFLHGFF